MADQTPVSELETSVDPQAINDTSTIASTEVHLDASISDRLAGLSISGDDSLGAKSDHLNQSSVSTDVKIVPEKLLPEESHDLQVVDSEEKEVSEKTLDEQPMSESAICEKLDSESTSREAEKLAEISTRAQQIIQGEISDNSECSVEIDDETSNYVVDDKVNSGVSSDEEMSIQDEDVEEEEEFHELEEDKPKTSQESFEGDKNSSPKANIKSPSIITNQSHEQHAEEQDNSKIEKTSSETSEDIKPNFTDDSKSDQTTEVKPSAPKLADWADIMSSTNQNTDNHTADNLTQGKTAEDDENKSKVEDATKKELDLDEDVKNPQYIPKKGMFYEHDDRSHDANSKKQISTPNKKEEDIVEVKEATNNKKTNTQEKMNDSRRGQRRQRPEADRWNHDLFRDEKQKPKSKSELIYSHGYDIRHDRNSRNQVDSRPHRGINNNSDRQHAGQDSQDMKQIRDNRNARPNQSSNGSRDRRPRRQSNRARPDTTVTLARRDGPNSRSIKSDSKDGKTESSDVKPGFQTNQTPSSAPMNRRDHQDVGRDRNIRSDNRSRRQNSKDRPMANLAGDDKFPPINTVMPPITTWSNKITENMVKEEATRKESPSRHYQHNSAGNAKGRSNDWTQNQPTIKPTYHDRSVRNLEENRHQQNYNSRRYQDRDENQKQSQFVNRNHYNDRSNQQQHNQEWRRTNHYNSYAKPNDYEPIKTQTFENSRLSQTNMNRPRDGRDIINERRNQHQQGFQQKIQVGPPSSEHQMQQQQPRLMQQQQQLMQHQRQIIQQAPQHLRQQQAPPSQQQSAPNQTQQQQQPSQITQPIQGQRPQHQPQQNPQSQQHQASQGQNLGINSMADRVQESSRANTSTATNDLINTRPIIKAEAYTGANVASHSQQPQSLQQHSQNHRSFGGPMSQQGPSSAGSHMVPSHLNASGNQAQYYSPSNSSRDPAAAAAALATAYHGYLPSGHSVMDTSRYHMTSQQLSDHQYMASPGQTSDVAAALHQQGMYTDAASTGGTVASSAYLAQAGSTLSPSTNIPVTGAGPPPMAPVSYLQHSQYPPYSNPYPQPQHNQAPPQSNYPYAWTYI